LLDGVRAEAVLDLAAGTGKLTAPPRRAVSGGDGGRAARGDADVTRL
jgi:hypothetical protein